MKDPIGERLRATRKQRKISVPQLSMILGIPKDRIYKWEKGLSAPKFEDKTAIEQWISNSYWNNIPNPMETQEPIETAYRTEKRQKLPPNEDYRAKYIRLLEQQNLFLQRTFEVNLNELSLGQKIIQSQVKAVLQWEAKKEANGDARMEADLMMKINKQISSNLAVVETKDMLAGT